MSYRTSLIRIALAVTTLLMMAVGMEARAATTLDNLQAAYNGESNAHAKYLAYAKQAETEGYARVAQLFKAAAKAEAIHAANHAAVIKAKGAVPMAEVKLPAIMSTAENLKDAITGESYERDTMYPDFLKQARQEGDRDALRTFNFAKAAEAKHAGLYGEALANLDGWKSVPAGSSFYVCPKCGETIVNPSYEKCPVCFTPTEKFEKVD